MPNTAIRVLATLSLSLALGLARAQSPDNDPTEADPPDRAARLSYIQGDVSMQPQGEEDWAPAVINRPLTTGDKLWTDQNSRAEIYVGPAAVRLDSNTGFSFLNVDDDTIQMRMTAGVINVNVRDLDDNDHVEIDTPNLALSLLRPGNYRVEVNDAGDTTVVKVSSGEAEATGDGQNTIVHNQQVATFRGNDRVAAQFGTLGAPDDFDSWALGREHRDDRVAQSQTAQYVDSDVTGYQDLDDNGSWSNEPEYGYVWTPTRVVDDWSPYRYGRWVWVSPWGWTWIDDAPWGYAPFHYGRWARVHERWCWVPGPRHVRAVYAPALVGWVGSPGVGVSVSIGGGVGWFPLGPREVYVPARRFSGRYVERVNVHNTVIVNRTVINEVYNGRGHDMVYRNRGATTVVTRTTFTSAGRVGNNRVRVSETEISRAPVVTRGPRIEPVRESRLGEATRVNVRLPPRQIVDRQVVVHRAPPAANAHFARNPGQAVQPRPVDRDRSRDQGPREQNPRDVQDRGRGAENTVHTRPDRPADNQPNAARQNPNEGRDRQDRQDRQRENRPGATPRVQPAPTPDAQQNQQVQQGNAPADRSQENRARFDRQRDDRPSRVQQGDKSPSQAREQPINREQQREVQSQRSEPPRDQARDQQRQQQHEAREQAQRQQQDAQRQAAASRQAEQHERPNNPPRQEQPRQERQQERQQERPKQESKPQPKNDRDNDRRDNDSKRN